MRLKDKFKQARDYIGKMAHGEIQWEGFQNYQLRTGKEDKKEGAQLLNQNGNPQPKHGTTVRSKVAH